MKNGRTNQPNIASAMKAALQSVERKNDKLASMQGEYMASCKAVREDIRSIYATAKDKGVITRALKTLIKTRAMARRMNVEIEGMEADIQDAYNVYARAALAWDSTPLAAAKGASDAAMAT